MQTLATFNAGWTFHNHDDQRLAAEKVDGTIVRLPHNAVDLPLRYPDETSYQRGFCYQNTVTFVPEFEGRRVSLVFDGAMANSRVFLNGRLVASHLDGYTPFEADLTGGLLKGDNLVSVFIDGSENPNIPPFGGQIDYLTYAGIYRDVWLKLSDRISIERIKIETADIFSDLKTAKVACEIRNADLLDDNATLSARLLDSEGAEIASAKVPAVRSCLKLAFNELEGIQLWDLSTPVLYEIEVRLKHSEGVDVCRDAFGFRHAEFRPDGFFLNGRKLKILGLNRHQSYPYVGYAMGKRAQERDAEILKHDLKCNLVRTSHYPQSRWFLDHCDRIGLLVFEEIPGWQHIGDENWKRESIKNVDRMIRRDWNRPSIILWGVRINESADDSDFYARTNALARELDPTRQTAGVRNFVNSELLEDVYTMNDFVLGDQEFPWINRPKTALRSRAEVTGLTRPVPYMVTEFNGHTHPAKRQDPEQHLVSHAVRYLEILNHAYGDPEIAGCIGWCMCDYNTHKDFGAGDRICHHGVMDMFRTPKWAAHVYASQCDPSESIVLEPATYWARGERRVGGVLPLLVLTNCDEVELRYGDEFAVRATPDKTSYPHLPRPPVVFTRDHFTRSELGRWGMKWMSGTINGYVDGRLAKTVQFAADPLPAKLDVTHDHDEILSDESDQVRFVVRAHDQCGNLLPFISDPVRIRVYGAGRLIGPDTLVFDGGVAGFWIESVGSEGTVDVTVSSPRFEPAHSQLAAVGTNASAKTA